MAGAMGAVPLFDSESSGARPLVTLNSACDPLSLGSNQAQRVQNLRSDKFGRLYARGGSVSLGQISGAGLTIGACLGMWIGTLDGTWYVITAHVVTESSVSTTRIYSWNTSTWAATEISSGASWAGPSGSSRLTNTTNRVRFCVIRQPRRYYFGAVSPAKDILTMQNAADDPRMYDPRFNSGGVSSAIEPLAFKVHTAVIVPAGAKQIRKTYRYARKFQVANTTGTGRTYHNSGVTFVMAQTTAAPYNAGSNFCIKVSVANMAVGAIAAVQFSAGMLADGDQMAWIVEGPLSQVREVLDTCLLDANPDNVVYGSIASSWQTIYDPSATGSAAQQAKYDIVTFDASANRHIVVFYGLAAIAPRLDTYYHLRLTRVNTAAGTTTWSPSFTILMIAACSVNSFLAGTDFRGAYRDSSSNYESPSFDSSSTAGEWLKNQGGPDTGLKLPDLGLVGLALQLDYTIYYKNVSPTTNITGGLNGVPNVFDIYVAQPVVDPSTGLVVALSPYYWIHTSTMYSATTSGGNKIWSQLVHGSDSFIAETTESWTFISGKPASTQMDPTMPAPSDFVEGLPIGSCMAFANGRSFVGALYEGSLACPGTYAFSCRNHPLRYQSIPEDADSGSRGELAGDSVQGFAVVAAAASGSSRIYLIGSLNAYAPGMSDAQTGNLFDDATTLSRATDIGPHGTQDPESICTYGRSLFWVDQEGQWVEYSNGAPVNISRHTVDDKPKAVPAARRGSMCSLYFKDRLLTAYTPTGSTVNSRMLGFSGVGRYWEFDDLFEGAMNCEHMARLNDATLAGTGQRLIMADKTGGALRAFDEGTTEWNGSNIDIRLTTHALPFWLYSGTLWHRRLMPNPDATRSIKRTYAHSDQATGCTLQADWTYAPSGATFRTTQPLDNAQVAGMARWGDDNEAVQSEVTATGLDPGGTSAYGDLTASVPGGWKWTAAFAELEGMGPSDRVGVN